MGATHKILPTLYILRGKQANRAPQVTEKVGMKQRIRVVGLIKNEDGVLVFKRNRGRSEGPVFWELPRSDSVNNPRKLWHAASWRILALLLTSSN